MNTEGSILVWSKNVVGVSPILDSKLENEGPNCRFSNWAAEASGTPKNRMTKAVKIGSGLAEIVDCIGQLIV